MTENERKEAIRIIKSECYISDLLDLDRTRMVNTALDTVIKALETVPCEDCISRQAALKKFTYSYKGERIPDYDCDNFPTQISFIDVRKVIRELPPAKPERKPGKWIHMVGFWECDQCHAEYTDMPTCMGEVMYKYCPMCGAKMEVQD